MSLQSIGTHYRARTTVAPVDRQVPPAQLRAKDAMTRAARKIGHRSSPRRAHTSTASDKKLFRHSDPFEMFMTPGMFMSPHSDHSHCQHSRHQQQLEEQATLADYCQQTSAKLERDIMSLLHLDTDNDLDLDLDQAQQLVGGLEPRQNTGQPRSPNPIQCNLTGYSRLTFKISHFWVKYLGLFCRIDLFGKDEMVNNDNKIHFWPHFQPLVNQLDLHRIEASQWCREQSQRNWWPRVIFAIWLVFAGHTVVSLVYQYQHDYFRFRLLRVQWLNRTHPEVFHERGLEHQDHLEAEIAHTRRLMDSIGIDQQHQSYLSECLNWLVLLVSLMAYGLPSVVAKYKRPFDFYFIRNILDYAAETQHCSRLIQRQVDQFGESSRNFTRALVEFSERSIGKRLFFERQRATNQDLSSEELARVLLMHQKQQKQQADTSGASDNQKRPSAHIIKRANTEAKRQSIQSDPNQSHKNLNLNLNLNLKQQQQKQLASATTFVGGPIQSVKARSLILNSESLSCRQLRLMVLNDHLRPINQAPSWIQSQLNQLFMVISFCFTYCAFMDLSIAYYFISISDHTLATKLQDIFSRTELIFLLFVCNVACLFFLTTTMFSCLDQIKAANQLRKVVAKVVDLNSLRFYETLFRALKLEVLASSLADCDATMQEEDMLADSVLRHPISALTSGLMEPRAAANHRHKPPAMAGYGLLAQVSEEATCGKELSGASAETKGAAAPGPSLCMRRLPTSRPSLLGSYFDNIQLAMQPQKPTLQLLPVETAIDYNHWENKMNKDLLLVIMHYRLFFTRLIKLIKSFGYIGMTMVISMFLIPFIGRLHEPYFLEMGLRRVVVTFACLIIVPVNICLIPICYMHRRCLDLYTSLNSLLAHATEIISHREGRNVYDRHLISMLRKELSHHEGIITRFACKFASISFTYPNMVRLHFYFGFLVLSIIAENRASEHELAGSLYSDPLGLF